MPHFSVVIPNWNGRALLETCLPSLQGQEYQDFEVVVVDGGSTDGSAEWLKSHYPDVRVVELDRNLGFAGAVNRGIVAATGRVIVLLNNDTEADPGWLAGLASAVDENPNAGIFASRVLQYHARDRIDSAGDTLQWLRIGPLRLGLFAQQIGHGHPDGPEYDTPRYVLSACAAAAAYRAEVFEEVGLFDERFVSYLEDVDLGVRAAFAGHRTLYVPDAVIYHMGSVTAERMSDTKIRLLLRNSLFLFFQYMPPRILLGWGLPMLAWPLAYAARTGTSIRHGIAAIGGLLRHLPAVVRRRREVRSGSTLDDDRFQRLFADPHPPDTPAGRGPAAGSTRIRS